MARMAWLRGVWGMGLCFVTGCLYHTTTGGNPPTPPVRPIVEQVRPVAKADPPSPVEQIAPYKARTASAIEPPPQEMPPQETPPPPVVAPAPAPAPRFADLPPPEMPPATPKDKPLVAAMRQVLKRHPKEAARELGKSGTRRERLLALLKLTADVSENEIDKLPSAEASALLDHLQEMSKELATRAPLVLRKMAYCRSIRGFGQYQSIGESPRFQAGSAAQPGEAVQVYAEVGNFSSRYAGQNHETHLQASLEILGKDGERLASLPLGTCLDRCLSRRQDYFLNCRFHVPAGLKPGEYVLRVTVRDATPGARPREARSSLAFRVKPRLP